MSLTVLLFAAGVTVQPPGSGPQLIPLDVAPVNPAAVVVLPTMSVPAGAFGEGQPPVDLFGGAAWGHVESGVAVPGAGPGGEYLPLVRCVVGGSAEAGWFVMLDPIDGLTEPFELGALSVVEIVP